MKSILYSILFLLTATHSAAQVPDTLSNLFSRDSVYFYIDGVKIRSCRGNRLSLGTEDVQIITGGLPGTYGDMNSSIIRVNVTPLPKTSIRNCDKEQNMARE